MHASGDVDSAQHCLGRAIVVQPEVGHTKYMSLAQLMSGTEARDLYMKGKSLCVPELLTHPGHE